MDIYAVLAEHGIPYQRFDHPAVFTCEESEHLAPGIPGTSTKNLFLRDRKGERYFLVSVPHGKRADLKALARDLGVDRLSFGSPESLLELLGVTPGAVTILGLIHDSAHRVEVILDVAVWQADAVNCHPLVNTASLVIPHAGLETFLDATGHVAKVIDVPERRKEG